MELATCARYSSTLDCTFQKLTYLPDNYNYSPYKYINIQHNSIKFANIRGFDSGQIFDFRNNGPSFDCKGIIYDETQTVYPCNPRPRKRSERQSEDSDRKKKRKRDNDDRTKRLTMIFSIIGGLFAVMGVVAFAWVVASRKRKERVKELACE